MRRDGEEEEGGRVGKKIDEGRGGMEEEEE